jgi:hypothetical protein
MLLLAACSPQPAGGSGEQLGEAKSDVFANGGFETGAAGATPPSWPVTLDLNPGITVQTPETLAGLNLATAITGHAAPVNLTEILVSATGPLTQPDAFLGATASLRWPRFGNQCALVNHGGKNQNVNSMAQTMTVAAGDVDPSDGKIHIRFAVAPVLENPGHPDNEQPYFFIQATNVTQGGAILYSNFNFSNQAGVPWVTETANGLTYVYTDWQLVDVSPGGTAINMGDQVALQIIAAGCSPGGHMGQLYVDGVGAVPPGLFVTGSGPAQVNACDNVTYNLTYENGGATPDVGVVVTFATPPGTTFQSINAPGLVCTTPAVGGTGTITCTVGALAAGAAGSFTITVNVPCGDTGTVTAGTYQISGTGVPPLLGPVINTIIGCTLDNQCPTGDWCHESAPSACTPTLSNGTSIPTDPGHNPILNGACTGAAAALVCTSGVCDINNNECGYANGDGPCTTSNGDVVCQSGVCDGNDMNCGLLNGDGTCTVANGPTICRSGVCDGNDMKCGLANGDGPCTPGTTDVCRSGMCSVNDHCEPLGGCNVDADCSAGNWCDESTNTCTPQLANGQPVPTDPGHTAPQPILNGTCNPAAGALTCVSGVCDSNDNACGYANGDGPCAPGSGGNGPVVCRSGMCSSNMHCEPAGGCNVDADCTTGNWCNETTHMCTPQLANGQPVPTDPGHTAPQPILNGTCNPAAGALTCQSGVCDSNDNECGYANEDGPCTPGATNACRSGMCSTNGFCEPTGGCNVDADCTTGNWCNETTHMCTPQLANGQPVPTDPGHTAPQPILNGTCNPAAGALTCVSGVCDKDNKCGYANGDGPCTNGNGDTVCRSTICATSGANAGDCVACVMDSQCPGASPTCNTTTNTCVQCTSSAMCSGMTPVCDTTSTTCVPCNGDMGSGTSDACNDGPSQPFCFLSGTNMGACGMCKTNADCTGHTGNICNTTSGLCISGCLTDTDCPTGNWCNETAHMCSPQVANGMPVPTDSGHTNPTLNGTCTAAAGSLTCQSGVCDTKDNDCGLADGDGPCTNNEQCRENDCNTTSMTCTPGCVSDSECSENQFCSSTHACTPKFPIGQACMNNDQCQSDDCPTSTGVCSGVIGSGNGLICATGRPGSSGGDAPAGVFGLMLAAAALARRRRA